MKIIVILSGIIYFVTILIGAFLQIENWPYGSIVQYGGFLILFLVFIPSLIVYYKRKLK